MRFHYRNLSIFLVLALGIPAVASPTLSAYGTADVRCAATPYQNHAAQYYGAPVATSSGSALTTTSFTYNGQVLCDAAAAASSSAQFGQLHALVSASAHISSTFPQVGQYSNFGIGTANANAAFTDSMTLTSAIPNFNQLIQYQVTLSLHANFTFLSGGDSGTVKAYGLNNQLYISRNGTAGEATTATYTGYGHVGDVISLNSSLRAEITSNAFQYYPYSVYASNGVIDASNTSSLTVKILTAGGGFTTQSGAKYQATPEPATMAFLGLTGLAIFRRRSKVA